MVLSTTAYMRLPLREMQATMVELEIMEVEMETTTARTRTRLIRRPVQPQPLHLQLPLLRLLPPPTMVETTMVVAIASREDVADDDFVALNRRLA